MRERLGRNVRRYRDRIGLSQAELAEAIGKSETSIGLLERGKVWPEYESVVKIAQRLEVPETALFEGAAEAVAPTPEEALEVLKRAISAPKPLEPALPADILEMLSRAKPSHLVSLRAILTGLVGPPDPPTPTREARPPSRSK